MGEFGPVLVCTQLSRETLRKWLRFRAPLALVGAAQQWFLAVNFVNPHDIMSFDYGGQGGALPPFLANAFATEAQPPVSICGEQWDFELPATRNEDLSSKPAFQAHPKTIIDFLLRPVSDDAHWRAGLNLYLNCARDSGLIPSMGSIGDCYDNGMIEAFWGRMQTELLNRRRWRTRVELSTAIFEYLEIFHNRQRRHSALGMRTPIEYEILNTTNRSVA